MEQIATARASDLDSAFRITRRRLIPFLLLMYILSFLDRANIGFAKQAFQASVGVSDAAYALGAGLFFVTYAALEVPSNLIMHRVGARLWMARIMVTWGLISAATMFVKGEISFYAVRLLLGAAEAGFFPGVILYLTYWFTHDSRERLTGFFTSVPHLPSFSAVPFPACFWNFMDLLDWRAGNGCLWSKDCWPASSAYGPSSTSMTSRRMRAGCRLRRSRL